MNQKLAEQTFYEILEVAPDATPQEIHAAYHRARTTYSPVSPALYSMFTREEAQELMNLIEEAFSILSNQLKRKDYDRQLIRQLNPPKEISFRPSGVHTDLPDFQVPESEVASAQVLSQESTMETSLPPVKIKPLTSHQHSEKTPEGFGRTRFSIYPLDPNFENEIKQTRVFDGLFLQKVRQYKKINLDHLCQETRISRAYLQALEANDYKSLPAAVFTRGFVIQMARILGLNEKIVSDSYMILFRNDKH